MLSAAKKTRFVGSSTASSNAAVTTTENASITQGGGLLARFHLSPDEQQLILDLVGLALKLPGSAKRFILSCLAIIGGEVKQKLKPIERLMSAAVAEISHQDESHSSSLSSSSGVLSASSLSQGGSHLISACVANWASRVVRDHLHLPEATRSAVSQLCDRFELSGVGEVLKSFPGEKLDHKMKTLLSRGSDMAKNITDHGLVYTLMCVLECEMRVKTTSLQTPPPENRTQSEVERSSLMAVEQDYSPVVQNVLRLLRGKQSRDDSSLLGQYLFAIAFETDEGKAKKALQELQRNPMCNKEPPSTDPLGLIRTRARNLFSLLPKCNGSNDADEDSHTRAITIRDENLYDDSNPQSSQWWNMLAAWIATQWYYYCLHFSADSVRDSKEDEAHLLEQNFVARVVKKADGLRALFNSDESDDLRLLLSLIDTDHSRERRVQLLRETLLGRGQSPFWKSMPVALESL